MGIWEETLKKVVGDRRKNMIYITTGDRNCGKSMLQYFLSDEQKALIKEPVYRPPMTWQKEYRKTEI